MVLCLSGIDPTGGAGLQADIETAAAFGGHALGIVTALTVQDTRNVHRVVAVEPALLSAQLEVLLDDVRPQAIKLGLLGDAAQLPVIAAAIRRCKVPVVCDPVLRAGGGTELAAAGYPEALCRELLSMVTVLTPNAAEARRLAGRNDLDACGAALLALGCAHVLITGGDEPEAQVRNRWYVPGRTPREFRWPRLPETFHGAGCTLATAIAIRLAAGQEIALAIEQAQGWTQAALACAMAVGRGRRFPGRHS